MLPIKMKKHYLLIILILCSVTFVYTHSFSNIDQTITSAKTDVKLIEDILLEELPLVLNGSNIQISGINYYSNIDSIVIGLEKNSYSTNPTLRPSMIDSIFQINSIIVKYPEELSGKNIIYTGSAIHRNAMGDMNIIKTFQTEIVFDEMVMIDWSRIEGYDDQKETLNASFEYVWWHPLIDPIE